MPEEGQSPVQRKANDEPLNPGEPWTPAPGENEELIVEFPSPAEVSSIRLTDEQGPVSFSVAYQPEEGADFIDYKDENDEPQVKNKSILRKSHILSFIFYTGEENRE